MSQRFSSSVESVAHRNGQRVLQSPVINVQKVGVGCPDSRAFRGTLDEATDLRDALDHAIARARRMEEEL